MYETGLFSLHSYFFNIHSVPVAITAMFIFTLSLVVFIREGASFVGWLYLLFSSTLFIWFLGMTLTYSSKSPELALTWAIITNAGVVFIPVAFYFFSIVILNIYTQQKNVLRVIWVATIAILLVLLINDDYITGINKHYWGYFVSYGKASVIFILLFVVAISRTYYLYWLAYKNSPEHSVARKRSKLLLLGFAGGSFSAMDFLPAYGVEVYPAGFVFIIFLFIYITYVIWNYKLVDITPEFASLDILETMGEGIVVTDSDGIVRLTNDAITGILGVDRCRMINRELHHCVPVIDFNNIRQLLVDRDNLSGYRIELDDQDNIKSLEVSARKLYDRSKNIAGCLYVVRDTTAQYHAEKVLQRDKQDLEKLIRERTRDLVKEKERAEEASMAKSRFLSVISHELRTPLNAIIGFSQLLLMNENVLKDKESKESVDLIRSSGAHLLELINDVLDFTRIETGNMVINVQKVNLLDSIETVIEQTKYLADKNNVTILNHHKDSGIRVIADKTRLKQVLINVVSNAIKYNKRDGEVEINVDKNTPTSIKISVADTGHGIKEDDLEFVFEPFERFEQSHGTIEGTGIGLAVTKQLVEAMDGKIGVESTYGKGSTFWIELPC